MAYRTLSPDLQRIIETCETAVTDALDRGVEPPTTLAAVAEAASRLGITTDAVFAALDAEEALHAEILADLLATRPQPDSLAALLKDMTSLGDDVPVAVRVAYHRDRYKGVFRAISRRVAQKIMGDAA